MNRIEKGASFPKYHDTFSWLSDSMIANECFNCSDPNVGLSLNEDRTYVKCYMGDTGYSSAIHLTRMKSPTENFTGKSCWENYQ